MQRQLRVRIAAAVATIAMVVTATTPAFATTTLHIDGSTTLFPLASKWASVYKAAHSWSITVAGGGSGKGIGDANTGVVDIGMSSRMKQSSDPSGLVFTPVARDALVIVMNAKFHAKYPNYIYKLSAMQVQQIFRGQITNWKQLDSHLPSHAIDLVGRTGASGTYSYFRDMFLTNETAAGTVGSTKYKQSARTRTYASNGIVRSTVGSDMYAIGYLSEAYVNSTVHALNLKMPANRIDIDGSVHPASRAGTYVVPTANTAMTGQYVYVRPLFFVTRGAPAGNAKTFIDWCVSSAAGKGQSYAPGQKFLKLP
jgi:phosphate transport system substrate-binding protein